ncbi:MAG: hypothetical protein ACE5GK_00880 [Nitrospiria bacterium]
MKMKLKGKKIACFLALPHHSRFFIKMREEIKKQGGELIFIVTLADYPYELDLMRRNLSFRYFRDYMTDDVRKKIHEATMSLIDQWSETCFKWDGFSRWPLFKQSWFFESVVEEYFCVERFIQVEKPDMFIAHHECNRWGQVIGHLTDRHEIPFVTFQEGDYYNDYIGFVVHTEYSIADLLWGEQTRRRLNDYRCSTDKMFLIGNTHIESAIQSYGGSKKIAETKQALGLPPDKRVVLFLVDIKYGAIGRETVWKQFLTGLDQLDEEAVLIFKWHPSVLKGAYEDVRKLFKKLYPSAILLYDYDPYKLIAASDYCVTLGKTTLAIEALAFGKPLFALPTSDTLEDYYVKIGVAQTVFPPGNWSKLIHTMKDGVPPEIQTSVKRHLEAYFYKLDGRSVERAIDRMSYIFAVRKEVGQCGVMKRRAKSIEESTVIPGRISFIVPSGEEPETLAATLMSLSQNVSYPDWEVVLVVHHEPVREMIPGFSGDLHVVDASGDELGCLYNQGVEAATGDALIFMTPGTLYIRGEQMLEGIQKGIAGVPIKDAEMKPVCLGIGFDFNASPYYIRATSKQVEAVGGGVIAMKRETYEKLERFDEGLANHLIEPDFSLTARRNDIPIKYCSDDLAVQYKACFFGADLSEENWKRRMRFYAKWVGALPRDENFIEFAKELLNV